MTDKGNKRIGNYILIDEIGHGCFSKVFSAKKIGEQNDKKLFAVKCITKNIIMDNKVLKKLLNTEVSIMNKIHHKNVMHLYDYLETDNNYYLVINYCNKGDLESYLKNQGLKYLPEHDAIELMK